VEAGYVYIGQPPLYGIKEGSKVNYLKNPAEYYKYMDKAVEKYRAGSSMEISIGIGLCEPVEREKSRKFCSEEYVLEDWTIVNNTEEKKKGTKISVGSNYTTIYNVV